MSTLSNDYHTKTVLRAIKAAEDYVNRGMASNAKRDVDRAKSYLSKVPEEDSKQLQMHVDQLSDAVEKAEKEEATRRIMVQLERHLRYAKEAVAKNNTYDIKRYLDNARREIAKLPEDKRAEQEDIVADIEAEGAQAEEKAKAGQTIRQLEREIRSAKDTIQRSGGSMSMEALEPYFGKPRKTMDKLPMALQAEWAAKIDDLVAEAAGMATPKTVDYSKSTITTSTSTVTTATSNTSTSTFPARSTATTSSSSPACSGLDPNIKRMIDRNIRAARDLLKSPGNAERAAYNVERARNDVERKVPKEHQESFMAELDALESEIDSAFRRNKADRLLDACRRAFDHCQRMLDETRRHSDALEGRIEDQLERLQEYVDSDGDNLDESEMETVKTRFAKIRSDTKTAICNYHAKEAEKQLKRYKESLSDGEGVYRDTIESMRRNAREAINRVPKSHDGVSDLEAQLDEMDRRRDVKYAAEDKEQMVKEVHNMWSGTKSNARFEGYQEEVGSDYDKWRASRDLGLNKTEDAAMSASSFLSCEQVKAAQKAGLDRDIAASVTEAKGIQKEALEKVSATVVDICNDADRTDRPKDLVQSLGWLVVSLKRLEDPDHVLDSALESIQQTSDEIEDTLNAAATKVEAKRRNAEAQAETMWPTVLSHYAIEDLDAADALEHVGNWKGKTIRFHETKNRMGWDFETYGNAFIARGAGGIPVMAEFTPELKQALADMESHAGFERSTQEFDDLLIQVNGKGKAQPIRWNRVLDRWDYLPKEDAVRGHVVAFRSGPFAADAMDGSRSVQNAKAA